MTFNRYVREVRDDGLVLYADGFPTRLCHDAAHRLASEAEQTFYWGDMDPRGVQIFALLEQAIAGLRPHPMNPELARTHGVTAAGDSRLANWPDREARSRPLRLSCPPKRLKRMRVTGILVLRRPAPLAALDALWLHLSA